MKQYMQAKYSAISYDIHSPRYYTNHSDILPRSLTKNETKYTVTDYCSNVDGDNNLRTIKYFDNFSM